MLICQMQRAQSQVILAALILGLCLIIYLTYYFSERTTYQHSAVFLSITGSVYTGFGLADDKIELTVIEILSSFVFVILAVVGVFFPLIMGIGFLLHAVWDCLHHWKIIKTKVISWYPPFCAIYDSFVGIFLLMVYLN
jgi:hypothetical protein